MEKKTIKRSEVSTLKMTSGNEKRIKKIIIAGFVHEWVGFGWLMMGVPTAAQKRRLHHVED